MDLIRDARGDQRTRSRRPDTSKIDHVTAKERLLREVPQWTDAQAVAALSVVASQAALASYLDDESKQSADELDAREDHWAEASASEAIREEPW
jgi:hypothetical protein